MKVIQLLLLSTLNRYFLQINNTTWLKKFQYISQREKLYFYNLIKKLSTLFKTPLSLKVDCLWLWLSSNPTDFLRSISVISVSLPHQTLYIPFPSFLEMKMVHIFFVEILLIASSSNITDQESSNNHENISIHSALFKKCAY